MLDGLFRKTVSQWGMRKKQSGDVVNPPDMLAGFAAAEFGGRGQGLYHPHVQLEQPLGLPQYFIFLPVDNGRELVARREQFNDGIDAALDDMGGNRLGDDIHHTEIISLLDNAIVRFARDEKYGNLTEHIFPAEFLQHGDASHHRHGHIKKNRADFPPAQPQFIKAFPAVLRRFNGVSRCENVRQHRAVYFVIVNNKERVWSIRLTSE